MNKQKKKKFFFLSFSFSNTRWMKYFILCTSVHKILYRINGKWEMSMSGQNNKRPEMIRRGNEWKIEKSKFSFYGCWSENADVADLPSSGDRVINFISRNWNSKNLCMPELWHRCKSQCLLTLILSHIEWSIHYSRHAVDCAIECFQVIEIDKITTIIIMDLNVMPFQLRYTYYQMDCHKTSKMNAPSTSTWATREILWTEWNGNSQWVSNMEPK